MIEHACNVTITHRDEICGWIVSATHHSSEVLTVALALKNRVAVHNPGRILTLPRSTVEQIIAGTVGRW